MPSSVMVHDRLPRKMVFVGSPMGFFSPKDLRSPAGLGRSYSTLMVRPPTSVALYATAAVAASTEPNLTLNLPGKT